MSGKKKLNDKEIGIKKIKTSFEKKNWKDKEKSWIKSQNFLKNEINKWIQNKKNQRKPISNEPNYNKWNLKKNNKNNWNQPDPTFRIL